MKVYKESYFVQSNNDESFQSKLNLAIHDFQSNNYGVDVSYSYSDKIYSALILAYTEEPNDQA